MNDIDLYAKPRDVESLANCFFYHSMDIPGHGLVKGHWDLRESFGDYTGHMDMSGKRILEIGPASGFFTFEMERRGADVVAVDVSSQIGLDFVPYPQSVYDAHYEKKIDYLDESKNAFWLCHRAFDSNSRVYYGDATRLPDELGKFDISFMGAVLVHSRDPLRTVEQCAKRSDTVIITDMLFTELNGSPVCRLAPNVNNNKFHIWWEFSTDIFIQFLEVMGFTEFHLTTHSQLHHSVKPYDLFTLVAHR